jgi:hypothetical protein
MISPAGTRAGPAGTYGLCVSALGLATRLKWLSWNWLNRWSFTNWQRWSSMMEPDSPDTSGSLVDAPFRGRLRQP